MDQIGDIANDTDSEESEQDERDPDYEDIEDDDEEFKRNRTEYRTSISMAIRYGLTIWQIVNLINAVLVDLGIKSISRYLSRSKVRDMKEKYGKELVKKHEGIGGYKILGVDGKKSPVRLKNGEEIQDKETVICQIEKKFVDYFIPLNGKAISIARGLYDILVKTKSVDTLLGLSMDGTVVNTGKERGVIRNVELLLGRPLQWSICCLHLIELVFKHLFMAIDGTLVGPNSYNGPIGKLISEKNGLKREKMVRFKKIKGQVPIVDFELENNDVKLFYKLCHLVQEGPSSSFANAFEEKAGKVSAARWITTGSNILLVYCQTSKPSVMLILLVEIIVNIYGPMVFMIKKNWQVSHGSRNYFKAILLTRNLLKEHHPIYYNVAEKVFKDNGYFSHPENILLSMVTDENVEVRKKAICVIEKARQVTAKKKEENDPTFRQFVVEKDTINFLADSYDKLRDFDKLKPDDFTDPQLIRDRTLAEIENRQFGDEFNKIPCHSQHVERYV